MGCREDTWWLVQRDNRQRILDLPYTLSVNRDFLSVGTDPDPLTGHNTAVHSNPTFADGHFHRPARAPAGPSEIYL
jgi:hypothetical protein